MNKSKQNQILLQEKSVMHSIIGVLQAIEQEPRFHFEFNQQDKMSLYFILHELETLGIIESKIEASSKSRFDARYYLTDSGKRLLKNRKEALKPYTAHVTSGSVGDKK